MHNISAQEHETLSTASRSVGLVAVGAPFPSPPPPSPPSCVSVCLCGWLAGWLAGWRAGGLSVCPSDCLSVQLSVCPSDCLSVRLSVCPSDCLSVQLSVCLSVRLADAPTRRRGENPRPERSSKPKQTKGQAQGKQRESMSIEAYCCCF